MEPLSWYIGSSTAMITSPITTANTTVITGTSSGQHAVQRLTGFALEGVRGLQQHRVERAGLLADLDHLQRQTREPLALGEGGGQADAVLDVGRRSFDIADQRLVPQDAAADAQRGEQWHAVLEQGAERARQPRGFHLGHDRAGDLLPQQPVVEARAERRAAAIGGRTPTPPRRGCATTTNHQSRTNRPSPSTKRENSGSSASRLLYISLNCGTT